MTYPICSTAIVAENELGPYLNFSGTLSSMAPVPIHFSPIWFCYLVKTKRRNSQNWYWSQRAALHFPPTLRPLKRKEVPKETHWRDCGWRELSIKLQRKDIESKGLTY